MRDKSADYSDLGAGVPYGTTQQHNTHIRDLREICYPFHPWHGRTVWVHSSLIKRGRSVAYCSLEDENSRVLEVPLWMLDVAACCKIRVSQPRFVSTHSLRELKQVLESARSRAQAHTRPETWHPYLLDAKSTDGGIAGSAEIEPTSVIDSSTVQSALDRPVVRPSTNNSAIAGTVTQAASKNSGRSRNRTGGVR
jgi:hypothetical protein